MNILTTLAQSTSTLDGEIFTTTTNISATDAAAASAAVLVLVIVWMIFALASYLLTAFALMKIFKKAGANPAWAAWVPFYNTWKTLELGGQKGFWAILAIVPIANIVSVVFTYIAIYNIGLKLGKSGAFLVLAIFLPIVWLLWLAFDKSTWDETAGAPRLDTDFTAPTATAAK